jgi:hypothetical protein
LVYQRQCLGCDAKYRPSVPHWIAIAAIFIGSAVIVSGVAGAKLIPPYLPEDEVLVRRAVQVLCYGFSLVGLGFALQGLVHVRCRRPKETTPDILPIKRAS